MADCTGLENRRRVKPSGSSNLPLSAFCFERQRRRNHPFHTVFRRFCVSGVGGPCPTQHPRNELLVGCLSASAARGPSRNYPQLPNKIRFSKLSDRLSTAGIIASTCPDSGSDLEAWDPGENRREFPSRIRPLDPNTASLRAGARSIPVSHLLG